MIAWQTMGRSTGNKSFWSLSIRPQIVLQLHHTWYIPVNTDTLVSVCTMTVLRTKHTTDSYTFAVSFSKLYHN